MENQIILSDEKKRQLSKDFKTTRQTVWSALTFKTQSSRANMLRKAALEWGGILIENGVVKGVTPEFETSFRTVDGKMVQQFSTRVILFGDLNTGEVTISVDGEIVETYTNPKITELPAIQQRAQLITNNLK